MATEKHNTKKSEPDGKFCSKCRVPGGSASAPKLSACARCGLVVYCSKGCQKAHWKASHKQYCIAKAERVPGHQTSSGNQKDADSSATTLTGEKCPICQDLLSSVSACTMPCSHQFHVACVAELRKFGGFEQACPVCRIPLPPGLENLQKHLAVCYQLGCGAVQSDVEAAKWLRQAAAQGEVGSQYKLGQWYKTGRGVAQSDEEAVRWFKRAAAQGCSKARLALESPEAP